MSSRIKKPTTGKTLALGLRRKPVVQPPTRARSIYIYENGLKLVPLAKPLATISCASPLKVTTGSIDGYNGAHTHTGPDYVIFMVPGFGFGGAAMAIYVPIASGHAFTGTHHFCYVKKYGNGAPSTHNLTVKGTVITKGATTTLEMTSEFLGLCGTEIACSEEGSFKGTLVPGSKGPLDGAYNGRAEWTVRTCPDLPWKASVAPV